MSLDNTALFYPLYEWAHEHIQSGRLPLISDLSYNGAPMPAVAIVGFLSPILSLFHAIPSYETAFNLIFIFPWVSFLFGTYFLGRNFPLSRSASIFLALLWTYNGGRLAHLDHLNITWACAFFPWVFWCLLKYGQGRKDPFWLFFGGLLWGLNLLSGHPQIIFYEGLFFISWALFQPSPFRGRAWKETIALTLVTLWVSSPLILHTAECLLFDGFHFEWSNIDLTYHSWTPVNFITLFFPWFFGRFPYDGQGSDYWWQYQFTEMQESLSIIGLFFVLLFLLHRHPRRRWLGATAFFGLLMAMGKFSPIYSWVESLPVFSFFRDPARYWFLISWVLGLGAAFAWEDWFQPSPAQPKARKISLGLALFCILFLLFGQTAMSFGLPWMRALASWLIQHFLLGDSLHNLPLSDYLARLPEKWAALSSNLNPLRPRVFIPLFLVLTLNLIVFLRKKWNLSLQKIFLLTLVFAELMAFRTPLGNVYYSPSKLPAPMIPHPQNRALCFLYGSVSPSPPQYSQMSYPDMNYLSQIPNLTMEANPQMDRYAEISKLLGWFSWVYKDRDPLGFTHHPNLMRMMGLDLFISDRAYSLPSFLKPERTQYPFTYRLSPVLPRAYLVDQFQVASWPGSIDKIEEPRFHPFQEILFDSDPGFPLASDSSSPLPKPLILDWGETRMSFKVECPKACFLVLQKTYLPGWKAWVNGKGEKPLRCNLVLTALPLSAGENNISMVYDPPGLRLGFFLFLIFSGVFVFFLSRLRVA